MSKKTNSKGLSRRRFLTLMAGGPAAFFIVPRHVLGGAGFIAPSEKLNVAVIGTGMQGIRDIKNLLGYKDIQVSAICDVSQISHYTGPYEGRKAGRGPAINAMQEYYAQYRKDEELKTPAEFADFREMFKQKNLFDAVLVATCDHIHATASMWAIKNNKHVYCEKPLTHSVWEARKLAEAAKQSRVATQMGIQGHSGEGIRLIVEWIRDGAIGQVREVHAWTDAGGTWSDFTDRPKETLSIPDGLDWDLWLGPAVRRPYHSAYHPYSWKAWWDFGTGAVGDRGCHHLDPAFWALNLGHPTTVEGCSSIINNQTTPKACIIYYDFPARGDLSPVKVVWYDGGLHPARPEELEPERNMGKDGLLFIGDKGKILCGGWGESPRIIPDAKMKDYLRPTRSLSRVGDHFRNWIDTCKNGGSCGADFAYSALLTEVMLLGLVAVRRQKKLQWDPVAMKAINDPEAEAYLHPEYENGWTL